MAAGRALKGRVWQAGRGVEQGVDGRGEVDRLGPHENLGGPVEAVQPAGEAGHERFLLGRGAQAEGDRAGPADDGETVGTEIDDPLGADPSERQAQRVGHRTGARGEERRCGGHAVGGGHQVVGGAMVSPRRGHPSVGGDAFEPAEGQHGGDRTDREGDDAVHGDGHDVAGGRRSRPTGPRRQHRGWRVGERSGRRAACRAVRRRRGSGPARGRRSIAGGHSPTPAARALAPL